MAGTHTTMEANLNNSYAWLTLAEDEEGGIIVAGVEDDECEEAKSDFRYCLVGRFLTDKVINFPAMKSTMASLWRPGRGVCIKDLSPTLFLFQFFHEIDINRVIDSGPWTFDQHILIVQRLGAEDQPQHVPLFHTSFWTQIYNLLIGFQSEKILQSIGNYTGKFVESNENNLKGIWRNYMRIRVAIDVRQPLKRRMRLKKAGGDWMWVDFKYERLNVFCFICGLLGHTKKSCPSLYKCTTATITKPFGHWMKAPTRGNLMNAGDRWLRSTPPGEEEMKVGSCINSDEAMTVDMEGTINPGLNKGNNYEGGDITGIMDTIAGSQHFLTKLGQLLDKGKEVMTPPKVSGQLQECGEEFNSGIIVIDAKQRRAYSAIQLELGSDETKSTQVMENVGGSKNGLAVGPMGRSGGLALYWNSSHNVRLMKFGRNFIDVQVENADSRTWRCTGFYGFPETSKRRDSWELLRSLSSISSLPWVCIGDFNDLLHNSEKRGRCQHPNWKLQGFRAAVSDSGLVDLGMEGYQYTCERSRDCMEVVTKSWELSGGCPIQSKLLFCGSALMCWGGHLACDFFNRSKSLWLKEGDMNSRYFHSTASKRKRQNMIGRLWNSAGQWCSNPAVVNSLIGEYFSKLFHLEGSTSAYIISCVATKITAAQNQELLEPFTAIDVRDALFSMHPDKSPGPDGMNPVFFQKFWHIVGGDVTAACLNFIDNCEFPDELNATAIVLIPKKSKPEYLADLRPIALCNVLYKIVAKMLANRMKAVLSLIISENQSAFVPGRAITDNILISAEIMYYLKRKRQGKTGIVALKIDMSKAYDRIEWGFLKAMMLKLGFAARWVELILLCVSTVTYKVIQDNKEVGPIAPSRGLRQGDPLSPYLFIICAEGLSSLLRKQERAGLMHGVRVARGAPIVTHLFFADDCFLFFHANEQEARIIKQSLASYGAASGQVVNYNKSSISYSANVRAASAQQVCDILKVAATSNHGSYLGLPSSIGRNKNETFRFIRDKAWRRLQSWNQKLLSRAGKEILLKIVAQAMPNYAMNLYLLPLDLCRELERMMNSFWWGNHRSDSRGINWMRWERLCKPKAHGGIGFKQLHHFNVAMHGKQGWRLLSQPDSLVARILKSRYHSLTSFGKATVGSNPSYAWRSIMAAHHVITQGSRIQIGNGLQTTIGGSPWLPDLDHGYVTTPLLDAIINAPVSSLMLPGQRNWDLDALTDIFNEKDRGFITQIPLSSKRDDDVWYWSADSKGLFTVRSCYKMLVYLSEIPSSNIWQRIWKLKVPAKVKHFMWRAGVNVLPTADNLRPRQVELASTCPICNAADESVVHCLLNYSFAKSCWLLSPIGFEGGCMYFGDWLERVFARCSSGDCDLAAMICWSLWLNRNSKVWKNKNGRLSSVLNLAGQVLFQWRSVRKLQLFDNTFVSDSHGIVCWQRPSVGWFKCNVDAATFSSSGKISHGAVIRNSDGVFIAARSDCFIGSFDAWEAEAIGVREILSWLKGLPVFPVTVEMDNLQVFNALTTNSFSPNGFGLIINDCRALAQSIGDVTFSFVRRSANSAAHFIARVGDSGDGLVDRRWGITKEVELVERSGLITVVLAKSRRKPVNDGTVGAAVLVVFPAICG
ncbi:reverse transcriptase domain-containing protein [Citrus sinensis]|uniref:Reverse transcriptase domain-containing protein n=1 Tax=Citrus sinensis TaxID=2711 RepID=A0ACB8MKP1_CITSI|nr:reverse transcriptase domain-containing protein [Citrus sinensis]